MNGIIEIRIEGLDEEDNDQYMSESNAMTQ